MKFSDLQMLIAIHELKIEMPENGEKAGSDIWTTNEGFRKELTIRVLTRMCDNVNQRVIDIWMKYRKESLGLLAQVAKVHGSKCAYTNRGMGDCSDDVDLDRIVPGSRGGQYTVENCQIACSRHNRERGDAAIEEYLSRNAPQDSGE